MCGQPEEGHAGRQYAHRAGDPGAADEHGRQYGRDLEALRAVHPEPAEAPEIIGGRGMKRVLCVCCVVLLVTVLAVPVMAAERYEFDWNQVSYLPSFDSEDFGEIFLFCYDGFLPPGSYHVYFDSAIDLYHDVVFDLGCLDIFYEFDSDQDCDMCVVSTTCSFYLQGTYFEHPATLILQYDSSITYAAVHVGTGSAFFPGDDLSVLVFDAVPSDFEVVFQSVETLSSLLDWVLELIVGNWFLCASLCVCLLGVGVVMITKLKRIR